MGRLNKVIGAISVLALLTGCSSTPFQAGAAATVGDHVIKTKEITSQLTEIEGQLAAQQGVPQSQLDSFFRLVLTQNYIGTTLNPKGTPQKQSEAGANYLINLAKSTEVSVSPRYGVWNPSQMMAAGSDNSLSFSIAGSQ